jgi:hypothetical protein
MLGVELDDASHQRPQRQERDAFVDEVFSAADLPLARVTAQVDYEAPEVRAELHRAMSQGTDGAPETEASGAEPQTESQAQPEEETETAPPPCPRCGTTMVVRQVKREGPRQGEPFWGCPSFPKCRGTRELNTD